MNSSKGSRTSYLKVKGKTFEGYVGLTAFGEVCETPPELKALIGTDELSFYFKAAEKKWHVEHMR